MSDNKKVGWPASWSNKLLHTSNNICNVQFWATYAVEKEEKEENMEKLLTGNNLKIGHLKILQAPFE